MSVAQRYSAFRAGLNIRTLVIDDALNMIARGTRRIPMRECGGVKVKKEHEAFTMRAGAPASFRDRSIDPLKMPPGFTTFYDLGSRLNRQLYPIRPLRAVGDAVGLTKQNTCTEILVALGKVAYALHHAHAGERAFE